MKSSPRQLARIAAVILITSLTTGNVLGHNMKEVSPDQLLLKDYRPRSIYNVPVTRVEKAKFTVIDVHSHPYARTPSQVEQWIRNMDKVGIEISVLKKIYGDNARKLFERLRKK